MQALFYINKTGKCSVQCVYVYNATSTKCQDFTLYSTLCSLPSQMQMCFITCSLFGRLFTSKPV